MPFQIAPDVELGRKLGAVERRVALLEDDLIEGLVAARRPALVEEGAALHAGELAIDEAAILRVVGRRVEAQGACGLLQAGLDGRRLLLAEKRIADLEGAGGLVHALGEQLGGVGRPLDVLTVEARDRAERQIVEERRGRRSAA